MTAARKNLERRAPPSAPEDVALIRFQLPHGVKVSHKFYRDDKIAVRKVLGCIRLDRGDVVYSKDGCRHC